MMADDTDTPINDAAVGADDPTTPLAGGTDKCFTCGERRPSHEIIECELRGPGRVGCLFGGDS